MDATFFHFMICNPIRQHEVWSFVDRESKQITAIMQSSE